MCRCVGSRNLVNEEALAHWGLSRQKTTNKYRKVQMPLMEQQHLPDVFSRPLLKCNSTRAEIRYRLSAKQTSPFKSVGASVQSTTDSRGMRISGSNAGYTMFRGSVKRTGYPLYSPVSPSIPLPASLCAITFQLESTALLSGLLFFLRFSKGIS